MSIEISLNSIGKVGTAAVFVYAPPVESIAYPFNQREIR